MIKVNLLPAEVVAERKRKAAQVRILALTVLFAIVLVAGFGGLFMLTQQIEQEVAAVQEVRQALDQEIAGYEPVVQLQSQVNKRIDLLTAAMGNHFGWRDTLSALGMNIPANVWLTNISLTFDGELNSMTLRGLTYNHPSTAEWIQSLQEIEGISDIRVSFSAEESSGTAAETTAEETAEAETRVRFEVRAVVGAGEEYQPLKRGE